MKTLNLTLRTILLTLAAIGTYSSALSYDFAVKGIYYNINGDEASVTYHDYSKIQITGSSGSYWFEYHYNYYDGYRDHVIIPENVTYNDVTYKVTEIGAHAFDECSEMTSVYIPNTVTVINESAFWRCSSLQSVTCFAITTPLLNGTNIFYIYNNLYVPIVSLEEYKSASVWKNFSNIIGFGQNTFSIADHTTLYGDTIVIPVTMENVDDITAFQTDIYLPAGFELLKDDNDYKVSLSSRKGRDHVIMASDAPDGAVRVLSYSPTLKKFSGNDGELFYLTIKVPNDGDGIVTYPIWLRKTLLTAIDEEEIGTLETLGNVNVFFYILGDVDHSGTITVTDVVLTAKYILFQNPEPFVFDAADMNGDGKITITDVVKIANLVLDQDYDEPTDMNLRAPGMTSDRMSGELNNNTVSINLDNAQEYTALQMDLTLPEDMIANEFALTSRASDLGLNVKDKGNGKIRVLAYSPSLKTIKGNDGTLLTFNVQDTTGEILVDRIEAVTTSGESYRLNGFSIMANNPTALDEMTVGKTVASVEYFNLAGQRMASPASGVTLVVTTYDDGSRVTSKSVR